MLKKILQQIKFSYLMSDEYQMIDEYTSKGQLYSQSQIFSKGEWYKVPSIPPSLYLTMGSSGNVFLMQF